MTADEREALFHALLGPAKLDSSLASRELADMTQRDVERLAPLIERIELAAYKAGFGAGLRQGVRVSKRRADDFESAAQIGQRLLQRGAGQ